MAADDPSSAEPARQASPTWRLHEEALDQPLAEQSVLPDLVHILNREVTKQGVKVIEEYGQLLGQARDEQTQLLVAEYLRRRLNQHLQHLEDVTNDGVNRMSNPVVSDEEERDGQEK